MVLQFSRLRPCFRGRAAVIGAVLSAGVLAAGWAATAATYATYMRVHGDWTVVCGRDEPTGRRSCDLEAPPPRLGVNRSTIVVVGADEGGAEVDGDAAVKVRIGHPITPGSPVFLRIDANPPHQAQPSRTGEAEWRGAQAENILAELRNGRRLVVRSFTGAPAEPRDEGYSLAEFPQALRDYREKTGS